ncbi:MAG TPA: efflux RND transporter periplasmic adaptor subunit, partial [Gemmatimonadaceae bacterium]|nr:efflux RND transporter periplasmic adaptor subunit [Gemmatimonadaceae bacterium]
MTRLLCCAAALALVACARDATPSATGDTAIAATADSGLTARDVALTPAQASRIHVATVTMQAYRPVVQTTGTVEFNGDRSTQVLAPVSGPITRILVNPGAVVQRGEALATVTSPDFAAATAAYRKAQAAYLNAQR